MSVIGIFSISWHTERCPLVFMLFSVKVFSYEFINSVLSPDDKLKIGKPR